MGKILIGNNISKVEKLRNHFIKYGFERFSEKETNSIKLCVFKKLKLDNINYLEINDDYVSTTGTIIYKGKYGIEALASLYRDFDKGIEYIRENSLGNYGVSIKKGKKIYIFTDTNAIQNIYYYLGNEWMITNTFYHLAKTIDNLSSNVLEELEYAFQSSIIGNKTIYENIFKLLGNEYIEVDITSSISKIKYINSKGNNLKNIQLTPTIFSEKLQSVTEVISSVFSKVTLSMTGGLDVRIIMASLLRNGNRPELCYGIGDSPITNTKNKDLEINKIYCDKFKLNLTTMNWKTEFPIDKDWQYYLEKYGELFTVYGSNRNIFKALEEEIDIDYITFGYFGELMRNVEWIDTIDREWFTLDEFMNLYFNNNMPVDREFKEKLYNSIYLKFKKICDKNNIQPNKIYKDDFSKIHLEYRLSADTKLCNLMNMIAHSSIVLSENELLYSILNTKYTEKMNAKYMLKVMKKLYEPILDVPFFSHCKCWKFNGDEFKLEQEKQSYNRLILKISKMINKGIIYDKLKDIYIYLTKRKVIDKNKIIIKNINKYISDNEYIVPSEVSCTKDQRDIIKYSQIMYMNKYINEKGFNSNE